jgi:hypothetical protein
MQIGGFEMTNAYRFKLVLIGVIVAWTANVIQPYLF